RLTRLAESDPSPVVRLYLASALQRLPVDGRLSLGAKLAAHAEDRDDANLPLMYWYGLEPTVAAQPTSGARLASSAPIPLLRRFAARRLVDETIAKGGNLEPLVDVLGQADEPLDLLQGMRAGMRGVKSLNMPAGWSAVYARLRKSPQRAVRVEAMLLALVFGDA